MSHGGAADKSSQVVPRRFPTSETLHTVEDDLMRSLELLQLKSRAGASCIMSHDLRARSTAEHSARPLAKYETVRGTTGLVYSYRYGYVK
jgi:hypothetical protein